MPAGHLFSQTHPHINYSYLKTRVGRWQWWWWEVVYLHSLIWCWSQALCAWAFDVGLSQHSCFYYLCISVCHRFMSCLGNIVVLANDVAMKNRGELTSKGNATTTTTNMLEMYYFQQKLHQSSYIVRLFKVGSCHLPLEISQCFVLRIVRQSICLSLAKIWHPLQTRRVSVCCVEQVRTDPRVCVFRHSGARAVFLPHSAWGSFNHSSNINNRTASPTSPPKLI